MEKEEALLKSDVRKKLTSNIDLWLEKAQENDKKAGQCSVGSPRWNMYIGDRSEYRSMAHAVFLVGKRLGLLTYDDYPVFKPSDKRPDDTNEEGK